MPSPPATSNAWPNCSISADGPLHVPCIRRQALGATGENRPLRGQRASRSRAVQSRRRGGADGGAWLCPLLATRSTLTTLSPSSPRPARRHTRSTPGVSFPPIRATPRAQLGVLTLQPFNSARSSLVGPGLRPVSRSACRTQFRTVSAVGPSFSGNRTNRFPLRTGIRLGLKDHPHSPITHLHRILPRPSLLCHDSILSRYGVVCPGERAM
jgi:hypothetical protein